MKKALITLFTFAALASLPLPVFAQEASPTSSCRPIYNGGANCLQSGSLTVDKKLLNTHTNQFVDHIEINEALYASDQTVVFRITVTNTGTKALKDITVTDTYPSFVSYTKGTGEFDKTKNTLTYTISNLEAKQANTVTVEGKIASAASLPQSNNPVCVANQVIATQGRNIGSDNSQFCITSTRQAAQAVSPQTQKETPLTQQPPVMKAPQVAVAPNTGPEAFALIGLIPAAVTGFALRQKKFNRF